jgi:hypothetical protein
MTVRQRSSTPPRTRRGGPITFRGVQYATEEQFEAALVGALVEAGWKLTAKGEAYLAQCEAAEAQAEQQWDERVNR